MHRSLKIQPQSEISGYTLLLVKQDISQEILLYQKLIHQNISGHNLRDFNTHYF